MALCAPPFLKLMQNIIRYFLMLHLIGVAGLCKTLRLVQPARYKIAAVDFNCNMQSRYCLPNIFHNLQKDFDAVLGRSSVSVYPVIDCRRNKAAQKEEMCRVNLYTIKASFITLLSIIFTLYLYINKKQEGRIFCATIKNIAMEE